MIPWNFLFHAKAKFKLDKRDTIFDHSIKCNRNAATNNHTLSMRATRNGKRDIAFYQSVKRDMPMENSFP